MRMLIASILFAISAFASAAPVPKELLKVQNLEGTTWSGDGVVAPTVYTFDKGGGLTFSYSGTTHTTGSWKQDGDKIYWETCDRYCEFHGTFAKGAMSGKAHNKPGGHWELRMTKTK